MKRKEFNKTILLVLMIVFISGVAYIFCYMVINRKVEKDIKEILGNIVINQSEISETKSERMLQLEELQKTVNDEIVGWLEIEGTEINYPVLQCEDNDFYLKHNYKKEKEKTGSLFLDKDFDFENKSSNYLIYGHRSTKGTMFEDLMKYAKKDFYEAHKKIKFTTAYEDAEYEILSVFYSRVYYQNETNVFRYYYFVNAENEEEYNEFIENAKKASIYDTGITAEYGEQLLTLSTCEYSQKNGRFAVVAKKIS